MPLDSTSYRYEPTSGVAKTLMRAHRWLETHEWLCRGRDGDWVRPRIGTPVAGCSIVAINAAAGTWDDPGTGLVLGKNEFGRVHPAIDALSAVIERDVTTWNDHPSRTKEEVLAAFRRAAMKADELETADAV